MATPTIISRTEHEILRLFVDGKSEIEIADFTTMAQRAVTRTINDLCAGDRDLARQMVANYERRASMVAAAQGKPGVPGLPRITTVPPRPGSPVAAAGPSAARATDVLADLLAAAQASPQQRTRSLGAKVSALAEDLRTRLREESRAAEAAKAAAEARAEAQRRVEQLAAELERAREALRTAGGRPAGTASPPAPGQRTASEVPAKTVRAWARENGVDVPALGRIPRDVMDAYLKANPSPDNEGQ